MSNELKSYYNIYNDLYDNRGYNPGRGNVVSVKRMTEEVWYESLPSKWKLLDIGCARGGFLTSVNNKVNKKNPVCELHGIDIARKAIIDCNRNLGPVAKCKVGSVTDIEYKDSTFDVIHSSDVLEHLFPEDRELALQEIYRILKPGSIFFGEVCLTFESYHSPGTGALLKEYQLRDLHIDPIMDDDWIDLFEKTNFQVTYRYTFVRTGIGGDPNRGYCRNPKDGFTTGLGQCHLKFTCQKND